MTLCVVSDWRYGPRTTRGNGTPNRRGRHTTLSGTYGDGAAVLDLTTFSGSIVISKR